MAKNITIDKIDKFEEDSINTIKEEYMVYCRESNESPSVVGMLKYLNNRDLLNRSQIVKSFFSKKIISKKPVEVIKELSLRYGIKQKTLWNYWEREKP